VAFRGRRRRRKQFLKHGKHVLEIGIVPINPAFQPFDTSGQVIMGRDHPPEIHKSTHHLNARAHGNSAFQHIGKHHRAMFGKRVRPVLEVRAAIQDHIL